MLHEGPISAILSRTPSLDKEMKKIKLRMLPPQKWHLRKRLSSKEMEMNSHPFSQWVRSQKPEVSYLTPLSHSWCWKVLSFPQLWPLHNSAIFAVNLVKPYAWYLGIIMDQLVVIKCNLTSVCWPTFVYNELLFFAILLNLRGPQPPACQ